MSQDELLALPPLRDVIAANGLVAKKSLGQNFLLDLNLTAKIARQAGDLTQYDVLEIGPGPAGLTRALLLEGARRVLSVEKDPRCALLLEEVKTAAKGRFDYVLGDGLDPAAYASLEPPFKIIANLPYNVGTELLVRWMTPKTWPSRWHSMTLMFQKEVAERIVAQPGTKAYGRLAILVQWRAEASIKMRLPASAFSPPPKVESAVVHITALPAPRFAADQKILERLTATAFQQRRKMLRASLRGLHRDMRGILKEADIDETQRAEMLGLEDFCRLARVYADATP